MPPDPILRHGASRPNAAAEPRPATARRRGAAAAAQRSRGAAAALARQRTLRQRLAAARKVRIGARTAKNIWVGSRVKRVTPAVQLLSGAKVASASEQIPRSRTGQRSTPSALLQPLLLFVPRRQNPRGRSLQSPASARTWQAAVRWLSPRTTWRSMSSAFRWPWSSCVKPNALMTQWLCWRRCYGLSPLASCWKLVNGRLPLAQSSRR